MQWGRTTQLSIGEGFDDLLKAARTGVPSAFERLYAEYAPSVSGYLRLQGAEEPEDLISEVFLAVFAGLAKFEGSEQHFRAWVFTITRHRLTDERRRWFRRPSTPMAEMELFDRPGGDAEQDALVMLGWRRVRELCAGLSADQREVILLRVVGDLTVEQVATVVGKSTGAVKALQRRALTTLRRKIVREGVPL